MLPPPPNAKFDTRGEHLYIQLLPICLELPVLAVKKNGERVFADPALQGRTFS